MIRMLYILLILVFYVFPFNISADSISAAAASNFVDTLQILSKQFEKKFNHRIIIVSGSTGKHYAQIVHGAPYDVFFAADAIRPEKLEKEGYALPGTRFTYAAGRLVLWSYKKNYVDNKGLIIKKGSYSHIAIANPELAPYGRAAMEFIRKSGSYSEISGKIVRGENIAQTFQYIKTENAELGFIALSQLMKNNLLKEGSYWIVPDEMYTPIEQQAVLLRDSRPARLFLTYVKSPEAVKIIRNGGYK